MEYRPNSRPEQSSPLQNATIIWHGPKYLIFDTKRFAIEYIHPLASRYESFSRFFVCCRFLLHRYIQHHYLCITIKIIIFESTYDTLFTGQGDGTICFHCGGWLKNWRPTDDAWREHALWFPYCVYIRYIKGEEIIRECRSCCSHSCNHTALTCFSVTDTATAGRPQASRHLPGPSSSSYNT